MKFVGLALGVLFGVSFLSVQFAPQANAALKLCLSPSPALSTPTPSEQQEYEDCIKQNPLQATTSQAIAPTQSVQQTKQPSGLTEQQVQAIVMLLQAFGTDQTVLAQVEVALRGSS